MMRKLIQVCAVAHILALFPFDAQFGAKAETFSGSNIDSRVIVGLGTDPDSVQAFLPDGWTSVPFPSGPLEGANLLVSFVDGMLMVDAESNPLSPASRRAVILLGLAKENDGDASRIYVMRAYTTEPQNDPYAVNAAAEIARTTSLTGPAEGGRKSADNWMLQVPNGRLAMSLDYTTGNRIWSPGEARSYSSTNPDFYRIYRYDSVTDLAMSKPLGKPLSGSFSIESSVPELNGIFNGEEEVVTILDIPVRVRKIFLP